VRHKRDMVSRPTGRPSGRPQVAVKDDPERYWITNFIAKCGLNRAAGLFERGIALTMVAVRFGELANRPDNVRNLLEVSRDALFLYASERRGRERDGAPRNVNAFWQRADDLCRKARRWKQLSLAGADGQWVGHMVNAWTLTLGGTTLYYALRWSGQACEQVGELGFHARVLAPIALSRFGSGPEPKFRVPEFIPRSCPRSWCNFWRHVGFPVLPGCQVATAGKMTMGLSLTGAIPASVM